ncbi:MAG TPA: hypothetical protein VF077_13285 [Nitrospiraceae bacterium]
MGAPISYPPADTQVLLADSANLSPFNRLRVADANTAFDSQQEYGLDLLRTWDCTANGVLPTIIGPNGSVSSAGNAVGPTDSNTRMTPITASATNGHYAILQSRQYVRYIPGHGHLVFITGIFSTGSSPTVSIVVRGSVTGSAVDTAIAQADWNQDRFDGTGTSGVTLDWSKTQNMIIDAQMLYVGRVRVGFNIGGLILWAHFFNAANVNTAPYAQTYNLPIRMEVRNTGAATCVTRTGYFDSANGIFLEASVGVAGGTSYFICCSVQTEGAKEARGFGKGASNGITTVAVTTRRPVLTIRPRTTFQGRTNRGHAELIDVVLRATTNDSFYEVVVNGTLTGASFIPIGDPVAAGSFIVGLRYVILTVGTTNFTLIGAASNTVNLPFTATGVGAGSGTAVVSSNIVEYDVSASAISGGEIITNGYAFSGTGTTSTLSGGDIDVRNPLTLSQIDALTANQIPVSVVCTAFSGTSNVTAGLHWHEQTI